MQTVTEGRATIVAAKDEKISKELDVFYNPVMQTNRDLSILLLLARDKRKLWVCDPLAGSGIRSLRFLKELPEDMIDKLIVNDVKQSFPVSFKKNAELSKADISKVDIFAREANKFLLDSKVQDYIDIDPFGTPNEFLDAAVKRTKRGSILAVTATDTAPLCGTYPKACMRKYWAMPRRDHLMHEYGLRILIRKCQLIGAQYDRALVPVLSYSKDHYFRIFFEVQEGKSKVDDVLKQHTMIDTYGPLWTGELGDTALVKKMLGLAEKKCTNQVSFLSLIAEELTIPIVGFHDVHKLTKSMGVEPPKHERIIAALQKKGIRTARTHFSPTSIKADCDENTIKDCITKVAR